MFKWLLIVVVLFLCFWLYGKQYIPVSMRYSGAVKTVDSIMFPLESYMQQFMKRDLRHKKEIIEVNATRLRELAHSVNGSRAQAVIFFYDLECVSCRVVLDDINIISRGHAGKGMVFFIVAFTEDKDKLALLLNDYDRLYFRPIMAPPASIREMGVQFSRYKINFRETPVLIHKDATGSIYESLTTDYSAGKKLRAHIGGKI